MQLSQEQFSQLEEALVDPNAPMAKRFRAAFTLRNVGGKESIDILAKALTSKSALLKHEINYILGQIGDPYANSILEKVLEDKSEHPMVRHEAAEALGAIGSPQSLPILQKFSNDPSVEVAETCQIAAARLKWVQEHGKDSRSPFDSVDPAPALEKKTVQELKNILTDRSLSLFDRYQALFALRNIGTDEAVKAMEEGLNAESALFRHEVAYVMGQLQNPSALAALIKVLENKEENPMVRHEAAESIGSIGSEETNSILQKFLSDPEDVVKESCEVALDISEYFSSDEFHYSALK